MVASRLTLYTRSVSVAGAAMLLYSLLGLATISQPLQWLLFSALVLLADRFTLSITSVAASVSVSDTFFIAAALLFGPGPAMVTLAFDGFLLSVRKHHDWNRVSFNTFAPALSLGAAAHAFFFLSGVAPLAGHDAPVGSLLLPLLILTLVYFGLNSGLTAVAVGLESGQPARRVWRQHLAGLASSYFAAASTALCLVLVVKQVGILAFAIIVPILAEFHLTLRTSFGRLRDAERHLSEMDHLYLATIETLAMAMDAKDTVTHSHVRRVQSLAIALAGRVGVTDDATLRALKTAALLHDTGKLGVPERILNKPGKLTVAEFEQMKRHVDVGADILSLVPFPYPVVPIVRCHHENWDGTGYPRGVRGEDIPIGARILSVADCYDALTSDRPYRGRLTDEAALDIVRARRGTMYDPQVVDALIETGVEVRRADGPADGLADGLADGAANGTAGGRSGLFEQLRVTDSPAEGVTSSQPAIAAGHLSRSGDDEMARFIRGLEAGHDVATLTDVLALSTRVVHQIAPGATGAWFIADATGGQLNATAPFGSGAALLHGQSIGLGEKLTGWVAVHRQLILNSDAALDLGQGVHAASPPLKHCLSLSLADGDTLAGVLTLYAIDRYPFSDEQGRRLQQAAPFIARAMRRAAADDRQADDRQSSALLDDRSIPVESGRLSR